MTYPYPDQLIQGVAQDRVTRPFVVSAMRANFDQDVGDYIFDFLDGGIGRLSLLSGELLIHVSFSSNNASDWLSSINNINTLSAEILERRLVIYSTQDSLTVLPTEGDFVSATRYDNPLFRYYSPDPRATSSVELLIPTPPRQDEESHTLSSLIARGEGRESDVVNRASAQLVEKLSNTTRLANKPEIVKRAVLVEDSFDTGSVHLQRAAGSDSRISGIYVDLGVRVSLNPDDFYGPYAQNTGELNQRSQHLEETETITRSAQVNFAHTVQNSQLSLSDIPAEMPASISLSKATQRTGPYSSVLGKIGSVSQIGVISPELGLSHLDDVPATILANTEFYVVDDTTIHFTQATTFDLTQCVLSFSVGEDDFSVVLEEGYTTQRYVVRRLPSTVNQGALLTGNVDRQNFSLPGEAVVLRFEEQIEYIHWNAGSYIDIAVHRVPSEGDVSFGEEAKTQPLVHLFDALTRVKGLNGLHGVSLASLYSQPLLGVDAIAQNGGAGVTLDEELRANLLPTKAISPTGNVGLRLLDGKTIPTAIVDVSDAAAKNQLVQLIYNELDLDYVAKDTLTADELLTFFKPYWRNGTSFTSSARENALLFDMTQMSMEVSASAQNKFDASDLGRVLYVDSALVVAGAIGIVSNETYLTGHYVISHYISPTKVHVSPLSPVRYLNKIEKQLRPVSFVSAHFLSPHTIKQRFPSYLSMSNESGDINALSPTNNVSAEYIRTLTSSALSIDTTNNKAYFAFSLNRFENDIDEKIFLSTLGIKAQQSVISFIAGDTVLTDEQRDTIYGPPTRRTGANRVYEQCTLYLENQFGLHEFTIDQLLVGHYGNAPENIAFATVFLECTAATPYPGTLLPVPENIVLFNTDHREAADRDLTQATSTTVSVNSLDNTITSRLILCRKRYAQGEIGSVAEVSFQSPRIDSQLVRTNSLQVSSDLPVNGALDPMKASFIVSTDKGIAVANNNGQTSADETSVSTFISVRAGSGQSVKERAPTHSVSVLGEGKTYTEATVDARAVNALYQYVNSPLTPNVDGNDAANYDAQVANDLLDLQGAYFAVNEYTSRASRLSAKGLDLIVNTDADSLIPAATDTAQNLDYLAQLSIRRLAPAIQRAELYFQNTLLENKTSSRLRIGSGFMHCLNGSFFLQRTSSTYAQNLRTDDNEGYGNGNEDNYVAGDPLEGEDTKFLLDSNYRNREKTEYATEAAFVQQRLTTESRHYVANTQYNTKLAEDDANANYANLSGEIRLNEAVTRVGKFPSPLATITADNVEASYLQANKIPIAHPALTPTGNTYTADVTRLFGLGDKHLSWEHLRTLEKQMLSLHTWANDVTNRFRRVGLSVQYLSSALANIADTFDELSSAANLLDLEAASAVDLDDLKDKVSAYGNTAKNKFTEIKNIIDSTYGIQEKYASKPADQPWPMSGLDNNSSTIRDEAGNRANVEGAVYPTGTDAVIYSGDDLNGDYVDVNGVRNYNTVEFSRHPRDVAPSGFEPTDFEKNFGD